MYKQMGQGRVAATQDRINVGTTSSPPVINSVDVPASPPGTTIKTGVGINSPASSPIVTNTGVPASPSGSNCADSQAATDHGNGVAKHFTEHRNGEDI